MTFFDNQSQGVTKKQVEDLVDRASPWDQFNQNLLLTVRALQRLHEAFDGKFTRHEQ